MKLGFLTACLPERSLADIAAWAAENGFEALEVAAWPALGNRPFTATHLDVNGFGQQQADEVTALFDRHRLALSSLAFYDNNLHPDPTERKAINSHVLALIDAAVLLGVPTVGTFVGRDPTKSVADNLREAEQVFRPLVEHAGERGVKIVIENCVMEGWHPDGYPGNLAYSPELWEWMFARGLYLNYDPSTCCGWASTRSRPCGPTSTVSRTPRRRTFRCSPRVEPATAGRGRLWSGRTRGTSAGGATASLALARSIGAPSWTPFMRAATTAFCRSNTKTPFGVARRTALRPACGSPTAPCGPCSSPDPRREGLRAPSVQQLAEEGMTP